MPAPTSTKTINLDEVTRRVEIPDFKAVKLTLASPEDIHAWSCGEVTKSETINYRTQKPERDGLFCQKIFGPVKDWECACGKYKRIRYKGIICDKCGVEVTRSIVRRRRMGHIDLAAPVSHIWFLRKVPSRVSLVLGVSARQLEDVIYFVKFIVTHVDEKLKGEIEEQLVKEQKDKKKILKQEYQKALIEVEKKEDKDKDKLAKMIDQSYIKKVEAIERAFKISRKQLQEVHEYQTLTEAEYRELALKYGHIFEAQMGAAAIYELLKKVDLNKVVKKVEEKLENIPRKSPDYKKVRRRLKLVRALIKNKVKPDWMILTTIPVIPPDLRPMVQLDGGRFATSDLNDLYRRVINRNNRLKKLQELSAPEVICRNEKRLLQEAVDALIDNSARRTKTVTASTGQKRALKSLADVLKGKQGRFRRNLLGKRVDYSGRSVITAGPYLNLHQCGLPKTMAIELFKPFVISELIRQGHVYNVRSANTLIEKGVKEVWDVLEEITKESHILLNRAPTLHRLSIQAFQPILIEGKALRIHPLVCAAFNADFDGDQMAVHIVLTEKAKKEAKELMLSSNNLLKPATGEPIVTPAKDMVWGSYYMTLIIDQPNQTIKNFSSPQEVLLAYDNKKIGLNERIKVKIGDKLIETGVGRVIFNIILPEKLKNYDELIDKKAIKKILIQSMHFYGKEDTAKLVDTIKNITLKYLTTLGTSWGMDDLPDIPEKESIISQAEEKVALIEQQFADGLLSQDEKHLKIIEIWVEVKDRLFDLSQELIDKHGSVYTMVESGARGSRGQVSQMVSMKGLVINPAGETMELPVKSSFREGFDVLEYFISTHGARKGLTDTALRTANAGYLTRRLVNVAQEVLISGEDCGDTEGVIITKRVSLAMGESLAERLVGRAVLEDIKDPKTKEVIVKKGEVVTSSLVSEIEKLDLEKLRVRSVLSCKNKRGICRKCYGYDLGYNEMVKMNAAVGVVAAQSIGEPGTQLTLRTFHTGGVLGKDITQGLPRVEEIFELRTPNRKGVLAEDDGKIKKISENKKYQKTILVEYKGHQGEKYDIFLSGASQSQIKVKNGQQVEAGELLMVNGKKKIISQHEGKIKITPNRLTVVYPQKNEKEYLIPLRNEILIKEGETVTRGQQLSEGSLDLQEAFKLQGEEATQKYIIEEIKKVYSYQGQKLDDRHVELIARQMFSRVRIEEPGESDLLTGSIITKSTYLEICEKLKKENKELPKIKTLLLGISKVSLSTESWLAAASFQETPRVLIDAAITGKVDELHGLKENVIIGGLIPARVLDEDEK
ncbi:MAG: DNA-directed RNA polymerase subunit beta' [Patescibacteria group bacterium]|nr:DNA-directed RNA polymerase subunit beta' [Patescibacteria group bacterium]